MIGGIACPVLLDKDCNPMFVIHDWQRQYAEALLATNPDELENRISWAQRAIASRMLQIRECVAPEVEGRDLRNASAELALLSRPVRHNRPLAKASCH